MRNSYDVFWQRWAGFLLAACAAVAYVAATPRAVGPTGLWVLNSPDAAAVQAVAASFVETGRLAVVPDGPWPTTLQHTRSFTQGEEELLPGTYIGLPLLYGSLGKIFGIGPLLWLTPLLAGLGVWLMFSAVRRWWGTRAGLIAGVVLAACPAYWYAATQPFTPAIPFVVLVGAALALLVRPETRVSVAFLGGLSAAAALAIRPHEVLWVAPTLVVVAFARRLQIRTLVAAAAGFALPVAAALCWQQLTFGSAWASGYNAAAAAASTGLFTFHPRVAARTLWLYVVQLHWWLLLMFVVAKARMWLQREREDCLRWCLLSVAIIAVAQIFTYASWVTLDSPGIAEPTIGNSQVRYLLPLLVALVPLVAVMLSQWRRWVAAALLLVWVGWGGYLVVSSTGDGTVAVQRTLEAKAASLEAIDEQTAPGTLIISGRNDKTVVGVRPTTGILRADEWGAVAAGLRRGWSAATYGVDLPGEATAQGLREAGRLSLPDGSELVTLVAL